MNVKKAELEKAELEKAEPLNVFGEALEPCSHDPLTGFFRDGCCNTARGDVGSHTVCAELTEEFLLYTQRRGNDLSSPRPEFGFPGLQPGQRWCLCASRWLEAYENGSAPPIILGSTHQLATEVISLALLREYALDLN